MSAGQLIGLGGWNDVSPQRNRLVRVLWGGLALITALGGIATAAAGTFAPPEIEQITIGWGEPYHVNVMRFFYLVASALLPISVFATWKTSHRAGLDFWRATARPAIMTACVTLLLAGQVFASFIGAGDMQLFGHGASALASLGLIFAWLLRGPRLTPRAGDAYWNKAFAILSACAAMATTVMAGGAWREWSHHGREIRLNTPTFNKFVVDEERYDWTRRRVSREKVEYRVPRPQYDRTPGAAGLFTLLAIGCFAEMRYRLKTARRAGE